MTWSIPPILALLCAASPAWADETEALVPVAMDWEASPVPAPPHAWIGAGVSWASGAQSLGGQPWGAGLNFSWVTQTKSSHDLIRFTHRTWRAPSQAVEERLMSRGVTEGVQSYWAGRMVLSGLTKLINVGKQTPHLGVQAGWRLQRTQHVGETTQRTLLREHDLYWGPQWTAHLGPELHVGYFKAEETLRLTAFGRYAVPLYAKLNSRGEGIIINSKLWDPVQTVAPEAEVGLSVGGRLDPYFIDLSLGTRTSGPSALDEARGHRGWQSIGAADLSVSKAF
jgi:hypothetical protein